MGIRADDSGMSVGRTGGDGDTPDGMAGITVLHKNSLFKEIRAAIIATDERFRITCWNRSAELMHGWTAEEAIGRTVDETFSPKLAGMSPRDIMRTLKKTGFLEIEAIHRSKDGTVLYTFDKIVSLMDETGRFSGTVGISRDITEQVQHVEALRKSLEYNKTLVCLTDKLLECGDTLSVLPEICEAAAAQLGFDVYLAYLTDAENGCLFLYAYSGFSEADAAAMGRAELGSGISGSVALSKARIIRETIPGYCETAEDMLASKGISAFACYPLLSEGAVAGTLGFGSRQKGSFSEDELAFLDVVVNNISIALSRSIVSKALEKSEARALALVEELKTADRSKNDYLNSLSHELRNPLATIVAGLSLLDISEEDRGNDIREALTSQVGQLCRLVDDLLDLTRMTNNKITLKLERVDVRALVLSSVKAHRALYEKSRVSLRADIGTQPLLVDGDPLRILQIIGNLLQNSIKFTDAGGIVSVRVYGEDGTALIVVEDNGIGISQEFLPFLFEPFKQAELSYDRHTNGLGLGLSISRGIAELHGGAVTAESAGLGRGAAFTIRLPLAGRAAPDDPVPGNY